MSYLGAKYINMLSNRLVRFAWKKQNLATCRCPICGDSKTSKNKTRFYFYEKKSEWFVKCHNCDFSASLRRFLKDFDPPVYRQYCMEGYADRQRPKQLDAGDIVAPRVRVPSPKKKIVDLPSIDSLPTDHPAVEYVRERLIPVHQWKRLYYAEDFAEFVGTIDPEKQVGSDPRIVIPMIRNGVLEGATGRALEDGGIRYITVKKDPEQFRLWFGLDDIDPNERVYITEGSIDSLFLPNGIAMNGLGKVEVPPEVKDPVFVLDNEPRNNELVAVMTLLVESRHRICVYPKSIAKKDLNAMVRSGMTCEELKRMVDENTVSGMEAKLRITAWRKTESSPLSSRWSRR
jgi:hypothetical protein